MLTSSKMLCLLAGLFGTLPAFCQTVSPDPAKPLAFDVVSVKQKTGKPSFMGLQPSPTGMHLVIPLNAMVTIAYSTRAALLACDLKLCHAPIYEIEAKVAESDLPAYQKLTWQERFLMLRPILQERFGLVVRTERKKVAVYEMVVAKGGLKLTALPPQDVQGATPDEKKYGAITRSTPTEVSGHALNVEQIVRSLQDMLERELGRPIVNKAELTGRYDFDFKFRTHSSAGDVGATGENGESLFTALEEQLGLKLQPGNDAVEMVIVDQAHEPTEN